MSLKIANNLSLPDEAVTQTFGILAKRGVDKSYLAMVIVEEMLKNNLHVVCIDPIGVFWGLRSSADGKSAGLPIVIAGGEHADVPIEPSSGEVLADLVVNERLSVVIDLSLFRKGEQTRFMTDFSETLYRRNRSALHLIVDEADAFCPQRPMPGEQRLLGAMEDVVRRGRARGIGVTMITLRPAVLNKNVLTQIEVLVALRLTSPQDRAAIGEWVKYHADGGQAQEMLESLGSLPVGTAWFWSPGWLDIFKKVQVRKRETLDSSSTPKVGQRVIAAQKMADVDLEKIRQQLSLTIEKVESDDPKVLRERIVKLQRQISDEKKHPLIEIHQVEALPKGFKQKVNDAIDEAQGLFDGLVQLRELCKDFSESADIPVERPRLKSVYKPSVDPNEKMDIRHHEGTITGKVEPEGVKALMTEIITPYAKGILDVFAQRWPMQLSRYQVSTLAGRRPRSSAFSAAMKELQTKGIIGKDGDCYELTTLGTQIMNVGYDTPKPSIEETIDTWRNALPPAERDLFLTLIDESDGLTQEELSQKTGRSITSSSFSGAISSLIKNGLAKREGGKIYAADLFFQEAR